MASVTPTPWYLHAPAYIITAVFFLHGLVPGGDELRHQAWSWVESKFATEKDLIVWGTFAVHEVVFVGLNLVLWGIYHLETPFFEQFKIQKKDWPWNRGEKARAEFISLVFKAIGMVAFNTFCISLPIAYLNADSAKDMGMTTTADSLPPWYYPLFQIPLCMMIEDTLFYWGHRTLHHKSIYKYVHKLHHQYKTPIGISSEFAHPLEYILSNLIPFSAGPVLLRLHLSTLWMWLALRIAETIDGHSGYEFPWSPFRLLPFSGSATAHDYHHSNNVGNYASFFTWWDRWCGTDKDFVKFEAKVAAQLAKQETQKTLADSSSDEDSSDDAAAPKKPPAVNTDFLNVDDDASAALRRSPRLRKKAVSRVN